MMQRTKNIKMVLCALTFMMLVICCAGSTAMALPVSVKLTSDALGLGGDDINAGKDGQSIDADIIGKLETSGATGMGSFLYIQQDGLAGSGSEANPLLLTISAGGHLDTPGPGDWNAGVLYISSENRSEDKDTDHKNYHPDGYKEGLGVRSFTIDPATGLRVIDPATGRARIEGSKHVSGGNESFQSWDDVTLEDTKEGGVKNGSPHVDEKVRFDFAAPVVAESIVVRFSEFLSTDVIDLSIEVTHEDGSSETLKDNWVDTTEAAFVLTGSEKDKLYDLVFSNIAGLSSTDVVTSFEIRAIDDNPQCPKETAEHFYITGIDANVTPEPASIALLGMGFITIFRIRRK